MATRIGRILGWMVPLAASVLSACGGGSGSSANQVVSSSSSSSNSSGSSSSSGSHNFSGGGANVVQLVVGPGPTSGSSFNTPTASVTVCVPGTSNCMTIGNLLVDTGSPGLRLMASVLGGFALPTQSDPSGNGNLIVECLPFADGYTWGPIATADISIGGEKASSVPINIIDDTNSLEPAAPSSCTNSGMETNLSSISALGANGVLGVGLFSYDCGSYCTLPTNQQTDGYLYYSCSSSSCTQTAEPLADQVINPVVLFGQDNNGVILQLPAIPVGGQTTDTGYLVFGIGTESNNALGNATVLTTSSSGYITTMFNGQTLSSSFLDSGSNGLFFADSAIPICSGGSSSGVANFYCPTNSPLSLMATNQGQNGNTTPVSFEIVNLNDLNQTYFAVNVGGPITGITGLGVSDFFDFGVPFFYGRTVFTAIDGAAAGGFTGPYYAY